MNTIKLIAKRSLYFAFFLGIVFLVSKLCTVYDKGVNAEDFSGGLPPIMGLLNAELFVAFVFCATVGVYLIIIALLWHYHEIPLHEVKKTDPALVNVVFGLALCGILFDKAWFVLAMVIAFMPWQVIGEKFSAVLNRGYSGAPIPSQESSEVKPS